MMPAPPEVVVDLRCGVLGAGVEHIIAEAMGAGTVALSEHRRSRHAAGRSAPPLLIADVGGDIDEAEQRVSELEAETQSFRLLVIMLVCWDDVAIRLIRAGAKGVLYPHATAQEFVEALNAIARRQIYLPRSLQSTLAQRYVGGMESTIGALTRRELEFVRRLAVGATTSEIAHQLNISIKTADTHRANIMRKLEVRNNVELARLALRNGLAPL
jgi:DNA-binding NarL/FixJ family response regulator